MSHKSVLLDESLEALHIRKGKRYIDATLGAGGHSHAILMRGGSLLGIDQDERLMKIAKESLKGCKACPPFKLVKGNFRNIDELGTNNGFTKVDGILMDLGISSLHLDSDDRGFSFMNPTDELDMRLDTNLTVKAKDLLNSLPEKQLLQMLVETMDFKEARGLSRRIVKTREENSFNLVSDLLMLFGKKQGKTHPATKAFMALRIAVNSEYQTLRQALPKAIKLLNKGGRLVVISFHSGEDRIVKRFFRELVQSGKALLITTRPIVPKNAEVENNPRSRSAKLRAIEII